MSASLTIAAAAALYVGGVYYLDRKFQVVHDVRTLMRMKKTRPYVEECMKRDFFSYYDFFMENAVRKFGNKVGLLFENERYTFQELNQAACNAGEFIVANGGVNGVTIGIYSDNSPNYVAMMIGASRVGVTIALLNASIKMNSLKHCINAGGVTILFYSKELKSQIMEICDHAEVKQVKFVCLDDVNFFVNNSTTTTPSSYSSATLKQTPNSTWCIIYSSGTTGLPKAALIHNIRPLTASAGMVGAFEINQSDVIDGSGLPLYHTTAGVAGLGMSFFVGAPYVLRRKFSATTFWSDAIKHKSTVIQYIGELCRYLLLRDANEEEETKHCIRMAVGSGMRQDIWESFQTRFKIPNIGELYGSTEGNSFLFNYSTNYSKQGIGACGHYGKIMKSIFGIKIAKYDVEKDELVVDKNTGRLIEADVGEAGEMLTLIRAPKEFAGYANNDKATSDKIYKNAFSEGDMYFRTGDLIRNGDYHYLYFVDRIGASFRWKGHNVSASEVIDVVLSYETNKIFKSCVCFGASVPKADGKACMIVVSLNDEQWKPDAKFYAFLKKNLPDFAMPKFIRIIKEVETTATFKNVTVKLQMEGVQPSSGSHVVYVSQGTSYVLLTESLWKNLNPSSL